MNETDNSTLDYGGICQLDFSEARKGLEASSGPYTRLVIPRTKSETKPNEKDREYPHKEAFRTILKTLFWRSEVDYICAMDDDDYLKDCMHILRSACAEAVKAERELLQRSLEFVQIYAQANPKWMASWGVEQDPHGVHKLISDIGDILSTDQGTDEKEADRG